MSTEFFKESLPRWIAYLLPKRVVYWAMIRAGAYATDGKYGSTVVPEVTLVDVLERWEKR